ncbi:MAG TPA: tetratricopeptide repeat protein [Rickettsia endosymbiont of Omalisus fontisbellaquei]|nr:tetratricopeptide repeat protein [Rickettsia endosymbiont of Omalisus fontisbellaquei]
MYRNTFNSITQNYYEELAQIANNLGVNKLTLGLYEHSIPHFEEAITLNKSYYLAHYNKGLAFFNLAKTYSTKAEILLRMRRYHEALIRGRTSS